MDSAVKVLGVNESTGRASPLLDRRGGCAIKKGRAATKAAQTGWLFKHR